MCGVSGRSVAATVEAAYKRVLGPVSLLLRSRTFVKGWWKRADPVTRSPAGVRSSSHHVCLS